MGPISLGPASWCFSLSRLLTIFLLLSHTLDVLPGFPFGTAGGAILVAEASASLVVTQTLFQENGITHSANGGYNASVAFTSSNGGTVFGGRTWNLFHKVRFRSHATNALVTTGGAIGTVGLESTILESVFEGNFVASSANGGISLLLTPFPPRHLLSTRDCTMALSCPPLSVLPQDRLYGQSMSILSRVLSEAFLLVVHLLG